MPVRITENEQRSDAAALPASPAESGARFLLVDAAVLPEVFVRVVDAKRLLATGRAASSAEAARLAGISRSAFYKYKDAVFPYDEEKAGRILTVHAVLRDQPGILSSVVSIKIVGMPVCLWILSMSLLWPLFLSPMSMITCGRAAIRDSIFMVPLLP